MDFSNTVLNAAAGQVAIWQRLRGVNTTIAAGSASGLQALGYAAQLIRTGRADVLVAGGAEEICFESFYGFVRAGRLAHDGTGVACAGPFDAARQGATLGEGAAFLVLEAEDVAVARGARILGRIVGTANGYDPDAWAGTASSPALARTINRALRDAAIEVADLGAVAASANGGPILDQREAAAIEATVGRHTPVTAIKSMTGETLGASGALQAMTALQSLRAGRLPGVAGLQNLNPAIHLAVAPATCPIHASRALVTALTPEGNCAALVLAVD